MRSHEILGVPEDADEETIKRAYRKKSKAAHPDTGGNAEQFNLILIAYKDMMDEDMPPSNVMGLLSSLYSALLSKYGDKIVYIDIPREIKRAINENIKTATSDIANMNEQIKLFQRINKCCTTENFIKVINNGRIAEIKSLMKSAKHAIAELVAAQEKLETTGFTPEARPVNETPAYSFFNVYKVS